MPVFQSSRGMLCNLDQFVTFEIIDHKESPNYGQKANSQLVGTTISGYKIVICSGTHEVCEIEFNRIYDLLAVEKVN